MDFDSVIPAAIRDDPAPAKCPRPLEREGLQRGVFIDRFRSRDRRAMGLAIGLAAAVHIGGLLTGTLGSDDRIGARGIDLDAVSVELVVVSAGAIETRTPSRDKANGAPDRVDPHDGSASKAAPSADAATAVISPADNDWKRPDRVIEADSPAELPAQPATIALSSDTTPAAATGGQAAIAIANLLPTPSAGAAEASIGEVQTYSVNVLEVLAKTRPLATAGMETGTVRIVFAIAANGTPENVRVSKSSGKPHIDQLVTQAIRATAFPAPPAHASLAQRTYELPYVFR